MLVTTLPSGNVCAIVEPGPSQRPQLSTPDSGDVPVSTSAAVPRLASNVPVSMPVTPAASLSVNGDGSYGPVSFTPNASGVYHWVTSYNGDSPNTLGTTHNSACTDTGEDVAVLATTMSAVDRLVDLPADANGTVTYTAYTSNQACVNKTGGVSAGGGNVTGGVADPSNKVDVAAGQEAWFTATFTDGTTSYTTDCVERLTNQSS